MSDGAITSQPALACTTACLTSSFTLSSLRMRPSFIKPSWPCDVYGSSATSHIMPISGTACLIARTARQIMFLELKASLALSLRNLASVLGNNAIIGMPSAAASLAFSTATSIDRRLTPGIEDIGSCLPLPSITKIGQMRSATVNVFSRTRLRNQTERRLRRMRVAGNCAVGLVMKDLIGGGTGFGKSTAW